ncbi:hypothetical protein BDR07DRAFT_1375282 [Suillus spraguei]|nr:hypothetical protein BDR07DRAFT_1375282 [Suillus spraguei]
MSGRNVEGQGGPSGVRASFAPLEYREWVLAQNLFEVTIVLKTQTAFVIERLTVVSIRCITREDVGTNRVVVMGYKSGTGIDRQMLASENLRRSGGGVVIKHTTVSVARTSVIVDKQTKHLYNKANGSILYFGQGLNNMVDSSPFKTRDRKEASGRDVGSNGHNRRDHAD